MLAVAVALVVVRDAFSGSEIEAGIDTEDELEPNSDLIGAATATPAVDAGVDVVDLKRLPPENNPAVAMAGDGPVGVLPLLPGRIVLAAAKEADF